jgi:uncharacterized protein (UPF0248 family)
LNDPQKEILNKLATEYKGKLDNVKAKSEITPLLKEFTDKSGTIPTKADIDKAIEELYAAIAKDALDKYSADQQKEISDLVANYKPKVEKAATTEELNGFMDEFRSELAKIKPSGKPDDKSTDEAKSKAKTEIDKAVSNDNLAKYKAAEQNKIKDLAAKYKAAIEKAGSAAEVNKLLNEFNTEIAKLKTAAQIDNANNDALKAQVQKATVKIKKPKTGKRKVTAKWTANKLFDGYQVSYKMKGKGKKWKKVTVKGATKSKKVIKKLKKGKKYLIKVRGYKTIAGTKVYSKYSKKKTTGKIK